MRLCVCTPGVSSSLCLPCGRRQPQCNLYSQRWCTCRLQPGTLQHYHGDGGFSPGVQQLWTNHNHIQKLSEWQLCHVTLHRHHIYITDGLYAHLIHTKLKYKLYASALTSGVVHVDPLVKCTRQQYIGLTGQAEDSSPGPDQAPLCTTCL